MIFRSGFSTQIDWTTRALGDLKDRVDRAARVATNQTEVLRPSDAAGAWNQIYRLEDLVRDQAVYTRNSRSAQGALSTAEGTIAQATNLITEARELAVQGANEILGDEARQVMATRIDDIREAMIGLANTQFADRPLFAGSDFSTDAFDDIGTYLGNGGESQAVISDGQTVRTSLAGDVVFSDALQTLATLSVAFQSGPGSSALVADELANLDTARESLVRARQDVGFDLQNAGDAGTLAASLELSLQESLNNLVAADPFESLTELSEAQSTYEVALQVTANVSSTTLFDFLR